MESVLQRISLSKQDYDSFLPPSENSLLLKRLFMNEEAVFEAYKVYFRHDSPESWRIFCNFAVDIRLLSGRTSAL